MNREEERSETKGKRREDKGREDKRREVGRGAKIKKIINNENTRK